MSYHLSFDIDFKRNPYKGKLIALDGLDGSGKTTQANRLVEALKKEGIKAIYTKEPTDEPTGRFIRQVLSGEIKVPPVSFQYLFSADRAVHQEFLKKQLEKGVTVITDRYFWSAVAYGMADRSMSNPHEKGDQLLVALSILSMYHQFLMPDLNLYLRIDPEVGLQRIHKAREEKELYEKKSKLLEIEKGYEFLLEKFPKEFTVIDGGKKIEKVTDALLSRINKFLK